MVSSRTPVALKIVVAVVLYIFLVIAMSIVSDFAVLNTISTKIAELIKGDSYQQAEKDLKEKGEQEMKNADHETIITRAGGYPTSANTLRNWLIESVQLLLSGVGTYLFYKFYRGPDVIVTFVAFWTCYYLLTPVFLIVTGPYVEGGTKRYGKPSVH